MTRMEMNYIILLQLEETNGLYFIVSHTEIHNTQHSNTVNASTTTHVKNMIGQVTLTSVDVLDR
jgi:hypothetical protein